MPAALIDLPQVSSPPRRPLKQDQRVHMRAVLAHFVDQLPFDQLPAAVDRTSQFERAPRSPSASSGWLIGVFGLRRVNPEAPIDVAPEDNPSNEPEPDLIVLKRDLSEFRDRQPQPQDLDLLVELSDTTLGFDLTAKAALYARGGIVEYSVLDVTGRRRIVDRDPQASRYLSVIAYNEQERVAPLAAPDQYFNGGDVLI